MFLFVYVHKSVVIDTHWHVRLGRVFADLLVYMVFSYVFTLQPCLHQRERERETERERGGERERESERASERAWVCVCVCLCVLFVHCCFVFVFALRVFALALFLSALFFGFPRRRLHTFVKVTALAAVQKLGGKGNATGLQWVPACCCVFLWKWNSICYQ